MSKRALPWLIGVCAVGVFAAVLYVRGTIGPNGIPDDAFKLIPLKTNVATDTAIVFVHGLDGDPKGTFHADGVDSWPDMMSKDDRPFPDGVSAHPLSTYATYTLDYRRLYKSESTVEEAAQQIAEHLRTHDDLFKKYNHVWFITHSLGGVLMKRVLLIYDGLGYQRLLSRIAGMFLLGVPSHGSPLANMKDDVRVAILLEVFGKNYRQVKDLRPDEAAAFLGGMEKSWRDFIRRRRSKPIESTPYIHCAYETDKTFKFVAVVKALYAQTECTEGPDPISRTHISLVKPLSVEDEVYSWTRDRLGRDRARLRQLPRFEIEPGVDPLGKLVKDYQQWHQQPADEAGLREVPETIRFADQEAEEEASRLQLAPVTYQGTTAADLFEMVGQKNRCVEVAVTQDRREIVIDITTSDTGARRASSRQPTSTQSCSALGLP